VLFILLSVSDKCKAWLPGLRVADIAILGLDTVLQQQMCD